MQNYKMIICYDGTRFNGWQKQGNTGNTIQEKLESVLSRVAEPGVTVHASGRTDAGVHAMGQVCSFKLQNKKSCAELQSMLQAALPEDIGIISIEEAPPRFHARLNCTAKTYVYTVHTDGTPDVFQHRYHYIYPGQFNLKDMESAAGYLCGTHDFSAFNSNKQLKKSAVRTIYSIDITFTGGNIIFRLRGNGFLYNMVRIIVGTLLEVGAGKKSPVEIPVILGSLEREKAGFTAPAKGLTLYSVEY